MTIINLNELACTTGALIGIDPGTKTLGIASSDITRLIATPITTIKRTKFSQDAENYLQFMTITKLQQLLLAYP